MSKIEWTDCTWNPTVGCSRVSAGCEHCYAERVAHRGMSPQHRGLTVMSKHGPRWTGEVRFVAERLGEPLRWRKPRRVFVDSMSDLFHEGVTDGMILHVFETMARCPTHTFQVLTKRPARALEWYRRWTDVSGESTEPQLVRGPDWMGGMRWWLRSAMTLGNVWLGVSVEDQATADERIPLLLQCPAAVRFVSYEPALGPVDFRPAWLGLDGARCNGGYPGGLHRYREGDGYVQCPVCGGDGWRVAPSKSLDWLIVGGESGPGARPFDVGWARSTIAQCRNADVPSFVKQLGARPFALRHPDHRSNGPVYASSFPQRVPLSLGDRKGGNMDEWPADLRVREFPGVGRG